MHLPSFSTLVRRTTLRWSRTVVGTAGRAAGQRQAVAPRDGAARQADPVFVSPLQVDLRVGDSLVFANSR